MYVADFKARPLAAEPALAESREPALVRELRERVYLVHELRELVAREKVAYDGRHDLGVDQARRSERVAVLVGGVHALADELFGARQPHAALVGEKFAHRADAAAAEVVDVVDDPFALLELAEVFGAGDNVLARERAGFQGRGQAELLVDLKAADAPEVVALGVAEGAAQEGAGVFGCHGFARAQLGVDVF